MIDHRMNHVCPGRSGTRAGESCTTPPWALPPPAGAPVFLLHGFGSSADEFRKAWDDSAASLSGTFLDGPQEDKFTRARRWFDFTAQPAILNRRLAEAADFCESRIASELLSRGIERDAPLALVGHSQGAMVCLELLRRGTFRTAWVVAIAGYLPVTSRSSLNGADADVFLLSSRADSFVKWSDVEATAAFLRDGRGLRVRHQIGGLPHQFSRAWVDRSNFMECEK